MTQAEYDSLMNKLRNDKQILIDKKIEISKQIDDVNNKMTETQNEMIKSLRT